METIDYIIILLLFLAIVVVGLGVYYRYLFNLLHIKNINNDLRFQSLEDRIDILNGRVDRIVYRSPNEKPRDQPGL